MLGNRITANALTADEGIELIKKALAEIKEKYKIEPLEKEAIFRGRYYEQNKVGSYLTKAKNVQGQNVILKLQLRPLPFDEGFIIRHIQPQIKTDKIKLPQVLMDDPWNEKNGYGFLVMEDLSAVPNLWAKGFPLSAAEMQNHKKFLQIFFQQVLPIEPFLPKPKLSPKEILKDSFNHFASIAQKSKYQHLEAEKFQDIKNRYFKFLDSYDFIGLHFTHGHLSGGDIKYDEANDSYILLANLLWSYRWQYYELVFPMWNNLMHVDIADFSFDNFLKVVENWCQLFSQDILDHDPTQTKQFWALLLERSVLTCIIDLGASEWPNGQEKIKANLLNCWQEFFYWVLKNKL